MSGGDESLPFIAHDNSLLARRSAADTLSQMITLSISFCRICMPKRPGLGRRSVGLLTSDSELYLLQSRWQCL